MGIEELADAFGAARPRLIRVAYAILGSYSDAEDVVAECWIQLSARWEEVRDVEGWCVVAVSRRAIDVLRSARVRRETYVGPWLPEPVLSGTVDPADRVTLDDEVNYSLLVVLELLTPAERTAFVLHDVFRVPFAEVATIVGRSPEAVRQLASKARRHVRSSGRRIVVDKFEHRRVVDAFSAAVESGDLEALAAVLDPSVVLVSDGGGQVSSARRPVVGSDRVARFLRGIVAKAKPGDRMEMTVVNGVPGLALYEGGVLATIVSITVTHGLVQRIDMVRAPEKLSRVSG